MSIQNIVVCAAVIAGAVYLVYKMSGNTEKKQKLYFAPKDERVERYQTPDTSKFYVYNYYKVPVTVLVSKESIVKKDKASLTISHRSHNIGIIPKEGVETNQIDASSYERKSVDAVDNFEYITLVENVLPGKFLVIKNGLCKNITDNKKVLVLDAKTKKPIGKSVMTIPEGKTIKALHVGMNSGSTAIEMTSDITKSPLGTALPRLRIVNVTPRTINLTTTGGNVLTIPASKSLLYFGEYENGIPMGVTFRDIDGILPDFNLKIPITDLFLGIISDIEIPLYRGSLIGQAFFDDPGVMYHPFQELRGYQLHRGAFIDKSYIPKDW